MSTLSEKLLESMALMSDAATNNLSKDSSVECSIESIVDASKGIYNVKYLENTISATASNPTIKYSIGDKVYVLIPEGNLNNPRFIIGLSSSASGDAHIDTDTSLDYIPITNNIFLNLDDEIKLCSYKTETIDINNPVEPNVFPANFSDLISNYLSNYNAFSLSMTIKTNLPSEQQKTMGDYGLLLKLPFLRKLEDNSTIKEDMYYRINTDNIFGNPYNLSSGTKQTLYFDIDEDLIYDVDGKPSIVCYIKDFIQSSSEMPYDVFLSNFNMQIVQKVPDENKTGYYLYLTATEGPFFLNDTSKKTKTITPHILLNSEEIAFDGAECYWFVEDVNVTPASPNYTKLGGVGWKCLNSTDGTNYVTNVYTQKVNITDVMVSKRYKCLIQYSNTNIKGEILFRNFNTKASVTLTTKDTTTSIVKGAEVNLICTVNYTDEENKFLYDYRWARYGANGNYIDNDFYSIIKQEGLYKNGVRIGDMIEVSFDSSKMNDDEINTIYCSAFITENGESKLIETKSITLTTESKEFKLIIENDNIAYNYDADGDSPLRSAEFYDRPISSKIKAITPLSFRLYKDTGVELDDLEYRQCEVEWRVPKESMFILPDEIIKDATISDDFYIVKGNGKLELDYTIADRFNYDVLHSNIILVVKYGDLTINESADIRFVKDGMTGTNGTKFTASIFYNNYLYGEKNADGVPQKLHFVYTNADTKWYLHDLKTNSLVEAFSTGGRNTYFNTNGKLSNILLKIYKDGAEYTDKNNYSVNWSVIDSKEVYTCFGVGKDDDDYTCLTTSVNADKPWGYYEGTSNKINYSNIIQAEVSINEKIGEEEYKTVLYCRYPIEITYIEDALTEEMLSNMLVPIINGGYCEVTYASDGTNPKYNSNEPFTCEDNYLKFSTERVGDYDYKWYFSKNFMRNKVHKKYLVDENGRVILDEDGLIQYIDDPIPTYQCEITPVEKFDDSVRNNYIKVVLGLSDADRTAISAEITELTEINNYFKSYLDFLEDDALSHSCKKILESKVLNLYNSEEYSTIPALEEKIKKLTEIQVDMYKTNYAFMTFIAKLKSFVEEESFMEDYIQASMLNDMYDDTYQLSSLILTLGLHPTSKDTEMNDYQHSIDDIDSASDIELSEDDYTSIQQKWSAVHGGSESTLYVDTLREYVEIYNNKLISSREVNDKLSDENYSYVKESNTYLRNHLVDASYSYKDIVESFKTGLSLSKSLIDEFADNLEYLNIENPDDKQKQVKEKYDKVMQLAINDIEKYCDEYSSILRVYLSAYDSALEERQNTISIININLNSIKLAVANLINVSVHNLYNEINKIYKNYLTVIERDNAIIIAGTDTLVHIKPINCLFNQYGMSTINGWDGSKLEIDENGQYILAPQMGAGEKNDDNTFTGLVMGKSVNDDKTQNGLLGYYHGQQSIFLDAETGGATFGIAGSGQIILAPNSDGETDSEGNLIYRAVLKSGNYVPKNEDEGIEGSGMEIDLATPSIRFGSENFYVTDEGAMHASGKGTIAGWSIEEDRLTSIKDTDKITIQSGTNYDDMGNAIGACIYSNSHDKLTNTSKGFYLGGDGLGIGKALRADCKYDEQNVLQSSLYVGDVTNLTHCWEISGFPTKTIKDGKEIMPHSYIKYGDINIDNGTTGVYLGTDGIRLGSHFKVDDMGVVEVGNLYGKRWFMSSNEDGEAYISYTYSNEEAKRGFNGDEKENVPVGFTFDDYDSNVFIGTKGISLGVNKFFVTNNGEMYSVSGLIGGWKISENELSNYGIHIKGSSGEMYCLKDPDKTLDIKDEDYWWHIDGVGEALFNNIRATGGHIGDWVLSEGMLQSSNGKLTLDANGGMSGDNWELTSWGGQIAGWQIMKGYLSCIDEAGHGITLDAENSSINGNNWAIDDSSGYLGDFYFNADGSIGGVNWAIDHEGNGNFGSLCFGADGSLSGTKWSIDANGVANFEEVYALNLGNYKIDKNGIYGGNFNLQGWIAESSAFKSSTNSNIFINTNGHFKLGGETNYIEINDGTADILASSTIRIGAKGSVSEGGLVVQAGGVSTLSSSGALMLNGKNVTIGTGGGDCTVSLGVGPLKLSSVWESLYGVNSYDREINNLKSRVTALEQKVK